VKISDFGVSTLFSGNDALLRKSAGSPAFLAPELCGSDTHPYGKPVDVWAAGVTLYCFIFRRPPFMVASGNILDIYEKIRTSSLTFPHEISPELQDLLCKLLDKNSLTRISLPEVKYHPWVTLHGTDPMPSTNNLPVLQVSREEVFAAFSPHNSFIIMGTSARSSRVQDFEIEELDEPTPSNFLNAQHPGTSHQFGKTPGVSSENISLSMASSSRTSTSSGIFSDEGHELNKLAKMGSSVGYTKMGYRESVPRPATAKKPENSVKTPNNGDSGNNDDEKNKLRRSHSNSRF